MEGRGQLTPAPQGALLANRGALHALPQSPHLSGSDFASQNLLTAHKRWLSTIHFRSSLGAMHRKDGKTFEILSGDAPIREALERI